MLAYDVPIKEEDAPVWHRPSEEELERQEAILRRWCNFAPRADEATAYKCADPAEFQEFYS